MFREIECSLPYPVLLYRVGFLCSISDAKLQGNQAKMQIGYAKRVYIQERGAIMTTHRPEPVCRRGIYCAMMLPSTAFTMASVTPPGK